MRSVRRTPAGPKLVSLVVRLAGLAALTALTGGCARGVAIVQRHHATEFGCDARYVRVERQPEQRYASHGCGFDAEWRCIHGNCELRDARPRGTGAP